MPTVRVMAVFQGGSLLPEDRFINTFHFHDPTLLPHDPAAEVCRQRVADFYLATVGHATALALFISPYVQDSFKVVSYNMLTPAGERIPEEETFTMPARSGTGLMEEVSIVCTLEGAPPVNPRRRGRIYFGPLRNTNVVWNGGDSGSPTRVLNNGAGNITTELVGACSALAVSTADTPWCIRSGVPTENYVPIVGGYVDNAFDTQRRRGPDATARTVWAPIG